MDYEKLKQCWYLATSGIHASKSIPNYKPVEVQNSFEFTNYLHRSRKETEETIEEWASHRAFKFKPLTLNLLFNEPFQPWTLIFETFEEANLYDLIHKHLMVIKESSWDYESSAMYNFGKADYLTDFTVKQETIGSLFKWCFEHRPDLLIDPRISSILTVEPIIDSWIPDFDMITLPRF